MNELEAKKRALVAESEVYRETLKLEVHNLRLYVSRTKQKLTGFTRPNPLLMLLAPLAGAFFRKRRASWLRRASMAFLSWQVSNRLMPFLKGVFSSRGGPSATRSETSEEVRGARH
jgi:hypothetical protein